MKTNLLKTGVVKYFLGAIVGMMIFSAGNVLAFTVNVTTIPGGETQICQNKVLSLKATPGGGAVFPIKSYTWTWDGAPASILTGVVGNAFFAPDNTVAPGFYTITCTVKDFLNVVSVGTILIEVLQTPVATFIPLGPTTFCQGLSVDLSATTGAGYTYQWRKDFTDIGGATGATYTATTSGEYDLVVTNSNGCVDYSSSTTVTVNPSAIISLTSAVGTDGQSVCINTPIADITYSIGGGGTGAGVVGLPAGVIGSYALGVFTISGTPTISGTFNFTVTTTGTCTQTTANGSITVTPDATIIRTSAVGTDAQVKCINTPITNITYSIGVGGTGAGVVGLPAGVIGSYALGVFTISGTPTASGIFNYTVTTTGPCVQAIANGTITVNPNATIALTSAVGTNTQLVCINTPITNITYSIGGGGTGAGVVGLPAGVIGSYALGVFTISGSPTASGTFNYTVTTTGSCVQATANGTITVTPDATISRTSAVGTDAQVKCINTAITNITYSVGGSGTGATVLGLPAGVIGSYALGVFTISGTPTVSGIFNYTVTTTGPCAQATANGTITVNPNSTIALTSAVGTNAQLVCISTAIANITYSVGGSGTGATVLGLPTGVIGTYALGVFTISGTPTASGTFNYTVTTTGPCVQATANGSITVTPNATISRTSAVGTDAQVKCINTAITNITYSIGVGGTGAGVVGLPAGVVGSYALGVFTISGMPTASGMFNYTVTTTGPCVQAIANGTITVTPDATISRTSAVGTDAQIKCINTAITNITYSVGGSGTGATVLGLPTGVIGAYALGVFTISGTPTVSGVFNYTVTTTGPCVQATANGTITVTPNATIALTSAVGTDAQVKCVNTAITNITYSVGGGGTGAGVVGLPAGVIGTYALGVFTISGTPTASGTFNYTVTTTGSCVQATANGTITVNPNATIALTSAVGTDAQVKCINTAITNITYSIGGSGTGATILGLPAGVIGSYALGVFTISGTPTANGTFNYTVTTTGPCVQATANGIITVNPNATIALTSAVGTNAQLVCISTPITNITYSVGGGGTGAGVVGLPAGVSGSYALGVFTISGTPTASGTFNYTVTTTGSCVQATANGTITVNPNATIALTSAVGTDAQVKCLNTPITSITYSVGGSGTGATVAGLPAGVIGSYALGVFTISGTPTVNGTFNYTVTTTGPCVQATANGTITVNSLPIVTLSAFTTVCFDEAPFALSGGSPLGGTYSGPGVGGGIFNPATAGAGSHIITYTYTDISGCSSFATNTITVNPLITNNTISLAQSICYNTAPALLTGTTPVGGTGIYSYQWKQSTVGAGGPFLNIVGEINPTYQPGLLTVNTWYQRIASSGTCSDLTSNVIMITVGPVFTVSTTFTTPNCVGSNTGTATALPIGGTPIPPLNTYTYSWNTIPVQNTKTAVGLSAGTYAVTVTDNIGCTAIGNATVTDPTPITLGLPIVVDVTGCFGGTNGSIQIQAAGGTSPYTYTLTNNGVFVANRGPIGTPAIFNSLGASTLYQISVTDSKGCAPTLSGNITVGQPALLTFVHSFINLTCNGSANGEIHFIASGGTPPYQYSILGGSPASWKLSPDFTGLTAGTYLLKVKDANSCTTAATSVKITQPAAIITDGGTWKDVLLCNGDKSGSISVKVTGGIAPFSFSIDGGTTWQATGDFLNLFAGTYSVIVKDGNGCTTTIGPNTINQPAKIIITAEMVDLVTVCSYNTDGSIIILATGGTGDLQFSIDGGTTWQNDGFFNNLGVGTYQVAVKDENGCIQNGSLLSITGPPPITLVAPPTVVDLTCNGVLPANGEIHVSATGGTGVLTYRLDGGAYQATGDFTGLAAGDHSLDVKDANDCVFNQPITVSEPPAIVFTSPTYKDITCFGLADGEIHAAATGGTGALTYTLLPGGVITSLDGNFIGLPAGTFSVQATDINGCNQVTVNFTIIEPALFTFVSATSTLLSCNGDISAVTLVTSGGTIPISYTLTDGGAYNQNTNDGNFPNVPAGIYNYTITDAHSCNTFVGTVTIIEPTPIIISTPVITQMTAPGANDGKIKLSATGGTPGYNFTLNPGGVVLPGGAGVDVEFTGLSAGTYTITVTDVNLCSASTLPQIIGLLDITLTPTDITCFGLNNGQIVLTINSGVAPYTITWTGPSGPLPAFNDMMTITGLAPGLYTVQVVDNIGVTGSASVTIIEPAVFDASVLSVNDKLCFGDANGSVTFNIVGGTPPYTISWTEGGVPKTAIGNIANDVAPGTYDFTITDAGSCGSITKTGIILADPIKLNIANIVWANPCFGVPSGSITVTATGGTGVLTYSLTGQPDNTTGVFNNLPAGIYTVDLKDANGCIASSDVPLSGTLTENPQINITAVPSPLLNCSYDLGSIDVTVTGGTPLAGPPSYTYSWNTIPVLTTEDLSGVQAGSYTVTVTDAANCSNSATATILAPTPMSITSPVIDTAKCSSWLVGSVDVGSIQLGTVSGGTSPYTYSWNYPAGGTTGNFLGGLSAGDYIFTILDANNCIYSDTLWVPSDPNYFMDAYISKDTLICGSASLDLVAVHNDLSPVPPRTYTYKWYDNPLFVSPIQDGLSPTFRINPTVTSKYYLQIENDGGCASRDSVDITVYPKIDISVPLYISALQRNNTNKKDTIIAILSGTRYNLDVITANTDSPTTFSWEPAILFEPANSWNSSIYSDKDIYAQIPTNRIVDLKENPAVNKLTKFILIDVKAISEVGCKDSLRLYAKFVNEISFGNVFSPNGDLINDRWNVPKDYLFPDLEIEIFNRWGALVWSAKGDEAAKGWDGKTNNGKELPIGTYYYVVKFNIKTTDVNWKPETGSITIVR